MTALALSLLLAAAPTPRAQPVKAAAPAAGSADPVTDSEALAQQLAAQAEPSPTTGPRVGQDVLSARVPSYPGAPAPVRVGDTLEAHGVPMNIQSFTTADPPQKVLEFYKGAFASQHLPLLGDGDLLVKFPYPSITAVDPDKQVDISVVAIRDTEHQLTTVLLALADMQAFFDNVHRAETTHEYGALPPYPSGEGPHTLLSSDSERRQQVVSFATADAPDKVAAYYRDALGKQGFQASVDAEGQLGFRSGRGTWQMVIRRAPDGRHTTVLATWSDRADPEKLP